LIFLFKIAVAKIEKKAMKEGILNETFSQSSFDNRLAWFNEPADWKIDNNQLGITSTSQTDFWQKTHYGFAVDNGHFLGMKVKGDFVCEASMNCSFKNQYDQAGLMIRVSDQCWIKTAVEFEPHESNRLGAVVTNNGYSDWSTQNVADDFLNYTLRVSRIKSDYIIECLDRESNEWMQLRLLHLHDLPIVEVGVYACSPKGAGFLAQFDYFTIK
jgi:regulation of enolase protein 1 (concanavalin A-like superfamily)